MSPPPTRQILEVPTLPPPSSRFVLPPPPSDLLDRLRNFLPQIKSANEQLELAAAKEGTEPEEEVVVLEELSDSSSEEESSEEESDEEDGVDDDTNSANGAEEPEGGLAQLLDINSRSKVVKKKLVADADAEAELAAKAVVGSGGSARIVEMEP